MITKLSVKDFPNLISLNPNMLHKISPESREKVNVIEERTVLFKENERLFHWHTTNKNLRCKLSLHTYSLLHFEVVTLSLSHEKEDDTSF